MPVKKDERKAWGWSGAATVIRVLPDGRHEMQLANGRRFRARIFRCKECQALKAETDFWAHYESVEGLCGPCQHAAARRAREAINQQLEAIHGDQWARERAERKAISAILRSDRRAERMAYATPRWVDRDAITAIYDDARRRTLAEGVQYHVDHIWPIAHHEFCGLHVPWNLRIITQSENCTKRNKRPDCEAA